MTTPYPLRTWLGLGVLCLAAGTMVLNNAVLSPLLRAIGQEFGTSDATTGQLATIGSVFGVGAALAATPWMDRWSRATWLRLLGSLILAGVILSALAPSFEWLLAGRVLTAASGSVVMANAMTGARELFADPVWRNRAIGLIVTATSVAFTFGLPLLTQLAAAYGWRAAMAAMAAPLVILLAGTFALPARTATRAAPPAESHPLAAFRTVLGDGRTRALLIVLGLNVGSYTGWLVFVGAYVADVFAASAATLSALFFVGGASQLPINNLAPPLVRRFGAVRILYATLALIAAALLLTGIVITSIPAVFVAATILLNASAVAYIAGSALLLDDAISHPGATMALSSATIGLGNALGPLVTGWALATTGSFEAAYRVLGLFAPVAMLALWLGTRQRAPVVTVERA
jgi:predicted MFS family arabinose efflux permease